MSASASPEFFTPTERWNQRFAESGYLFGLEPNVWLRQHAGCWLPGQRVLSVADGDGRNSVWLAEQGLVVDAFDISEVGVVKAQKLAVERRVAVDYRVSDCDAYNWPQAAFDGVAGIFIQFASPAMRQRLFANMVRSLKPGGTLVLQGYGHKQLEYKTGGPPELAHLYTPDLLREAFGELEIVELKEYEAALAEGSAHNGKSALLGLLARKPQVAGGVAGGVASAGALVGLAHGLN
jgi:SAM-dependent methyltransferase